MRNTQMRENAPPTNSSGTKKKQHSTTLPGLCLNEDHTAQVETTLPPLGEASSNDSDEEDTNTVNKAKGKRHGFMSGNVSKLTSRVPCPQLRPHSHLSLAYVSKDKKYDDLTLVGFTMGYPRILQLSNLL